MLKDWILRSSSQRCICKVVSVIGSTALLAIAAIGKLTAFASLLWTASPLLLFWLIDLGLAAEQRRCADLLKKNPTKEDPSVLLWEGGDASLFRFYRSLISLSTSPFYLILFALVGFGGDQIVKANKEAAAEAAQKTVSPVPPYYQQGNVPTYPNGMPRPNSNQPPFNPAMQRFTPSPFPTPPRFPIPNRPPATPPKTLTPSSSPASSPAPAVKGP